MAFHDSLLPVSVSGSVFPRITRLVFPWHDGYKVTDLVAEYDFNSPVSEGLLCERGREFWAPSDANSSAMPYVTKKLFCLDECV